MTEVKQFSTNRRTIEFKIDDDTFYATGSVPAGVMREMLSIQGDMNSSSSSEQYDLMIKIFEHLLLKDSLELFKYRLNSADNPIDLSVLPDVIEWLVGEATGQRPTRQPSDSIDGQMTIGESSTAGVQVQGSTPMNSVGADF